MLYPLSYEGGTAEQASGDGRDQGPGAEVRRRTDRGKLPDRAPSSRTDAALHGRDPGHHLGRDRSALRGGGPARGRAPSGPDLERPRPPLRARLASSDLEASSTYEYEVFLDDEQVWPLADSPFPPSVIRTPNPDTPFRLAFGSCRRSAPFDDDTLEALGADALIALAGRMRGEPTDRWPDALLMLGDQVYADDPSEQIVDRLHERHEQQGRDVDNGGRRRDPRLRGVHLAVRGGVDGAVGAVAPVDRPDGDAARRPRPARRLEHVDVVAALGHRAGLVARPGRRRLRLVLGVPAPGQPQPDRARDRARLRPDAHADDGRGAHQVPRRLGLARRPGRLDVALQLLPRPRRDRAGGAGRRHRFALLAPPRPRRSAHGRQHRVGVGAGEGARHLDRVGSPRPVLDAAVADAARRAPHGGLERGRRPGRLGQVPGPVRRVVPPVPRPRALGRLPRVLRRDDRAARRRRPPGRGAVDDPDAVRRRPLQLHRPGRADRRSSTQTPRSTS